jgi:hypothetical protein
MQSRKLEDALKNLRTAIQDVEAVVEEMRSEKDPLAVHIFVSRRNYRNVHDTKAANDAKPPPGSVGSPPATWVFARRSANGNG